MQLLKILSYRYTRYLHLLLPLPHVSTGVTTLLNAEQTSFYLNVIDNILDTPENAMTDILFVTSGMER